MKLFLFLMLQSFVTYCSLGQSTVVNIDTNNVVNAKGQAKIYINKNGKTYITNINNYNEKETEYILDASKYLDISKPLLFDFGGNTSSGMVSGTGDIYPFLLSDPNEREDQRKILKFTIDKKSLKISSEIYGFDRKNICRIVNNKLIIVQSGSKVYAADNYFEVIDDYNIPVLQIELNKQNNSIKLGGAFNFAKSFYIITAKGMYPTFFAPGKAGMSEIEKNQLLDFYLKTAEKIKPIHEGVN